MSTCKRARFEHILSSFRLNVPQILSASTTTAFAPTSTARTPTAPALHPTHCPVPSVRRHMQAVVAEFRSILKDVARVVHGTSTERPRIRTAAGRILYRTRHLPWESELFEYAQAIRRVNGELESRRMRAKERTERVAVRDRWLRRLQDDIERLYDAC